MMLSADQQQQQRAAVSELRIVDFAKLLNNFVILQ